MFLFDMDGVLIDSATEHALIAYNTVTGSGVERAEDLPPGYLPCFRKNRWHIHHAAEFIPLTNWAIEQAKQGRNPGMSKAEGEALLKMDHQIAKLEEQRFFGVRTEFAAKHRTAWLNLSPPVQPLWRVLQEAQNFELVILTTKNRRAVMDICQHFGLTILEANIYSGDGRTTKEENLAAILARFADPEIRFLEDNLDNLVAARSFIGTSRSYLPLLASWGYTSEEEIQRAGELGIRVVEQLEVVEMLQVKNN